MKIHGWGRYPVVQAHVQTPADPVMAANMVRGSRPLIARGMGRSYGDSALAPRVLDLTRHAWLHDFDDDTGVLSCAAGTTLETLLNVFVARGWFLPITPGTRYVSVGGAIASDVHGKNHHHDGCFSRCVLNFDLLLGDGSVVTCSPQKHADLFHATCGGMGLTGVILRASLRLRRVASAYIDQATTKARNLAHALELFSAHANATYSVAWLDCVATGARLGRGLLSTGEHTPVGKTATRTPKPVPLLMDFPAAVLNRHTIGAFNALYYHKQRQPRRLDVVHYQPFFYPLDRILHWNRMYGRAGFVQYQCVLPHAAAQGLQVLLERIAASGRGSFLAVLKELGPANDSPLSFPQAGYTLALDFKMAYGLLPLLDELDAIVLDHGGRLYLAKDARMSAATFKRSYPRWEAFQQVRERYGALGHYASLQSRRLGLDP